MRLRGLIVLFVVQMVMYSAMVRGQTNLVPNPGFEDWDSCAAGVSNANILEYWFNPWLTSSDAHHVCSDNAMSGVPDNVAGSQYPASGNGMGGLVAHWLGGDGYSSYCEFLSVELTDTLWGGVDYRVNMNLSLAERSYGPMDHVGAYISKDLSFFPDTLWFLLNEPAQLLADTPIGDTTQWVELSTTFTATGGEQFLTIGAFAPHHSEINVDTFDNLIASVGVYYYVDDVSVVRVSELPTIPDDILLYPSPNNGQFTIRYGFEQEQTGQVRIYDLLGQQLLNRPLGTGWGYRQFSVPWFADGTYLYEVEVDGAIVKRDKFQVVR